MQFNIYQHPQQHLVAKSSKHAYGCPTTVSDSTSGISLVHFDEQSFIRNLLTNDRALHQQTFQSNETLSGSVATGYQPQASSASIKQRRNSKTLQNANSNRVLASTNF
jgi:hypothetical protein